AAKSSAGHRWHWTAPDGCRILRKNKEGSMQFRKPAVALTAIAIIAGMGTASAQRGAVTAWAPQPEKLEPFKAPNKLHKKLVDVLARHKNQKAWSETMALTRD